MRKILAIYAVPLCAALTIFAIFTAYITGFSKFVVAALFDNNFHEVLPRELYRSAQMDKASLCHHIQAYGISSVIDLRRGQSKPDIFGENEQNWVNQCGAVYYHVPFATTHIPNQAGLAALITALSEAPRPVLIHCTSGAHRTSIASAIYLLTQHDVDINTAMQQRSMQYGFSDFEFVWSRVRNKKPPMATLLDNFQRSGFSRFESWVKSQEYLSQEGYTFPRNLLEVEYGEGATFKRVTPLGLVPVHSPVKDVDAAQEVNGHIG